MKLDAKVNGTWYKSQWNLMQKSMELGTKVSGTWYKNQWSGVSEMELAAKTNGAGCEGQWSRLQKSMERAAVSVNNNRSILRYQTADTGVSY